MNNFRYTLPLLFIGALVALIGCKKSQAPVVQNPAVAPEQVDVARGQSVANLKQVILAWHLFHEFAGVLPHDGWTHANRPALSWRVAILPFLEQDDLYRQFKLDEPWDSDHNKKLIPKMPKSYASGGLDPKDGKTRYRGFVGSDTVLPPLTKVGNKVAGRKRDLKGNREGHTIGVVETEDAVTWTKPDDVPFPGPLPALHKWAGGRVLVAFLDGRVRIGDSALLTDDRFRWYISITDNSVLTVPRDLWAEPPPPPPLTEVEQKKRDEEEARFAAVEAKRRELRAAFDKWVEGHEQARKVLERQLSELENQLAQARKVRAIRSESLKGLATQLDELAASCDTLTRDSATAAKALAVAEANATAAKAELARTEAKVTETAHAAAALSELVVTEKRYLARLVKAHDAATDPCERRELGDQIAKQSKNLDTTVARARAATDTAANVRKLAATAADEVVRLLAVANKQRLRAADVSVMRREAEQKLIEVQKTKSGLASLALDEDKSADKLMSELEAVRKKIHSHDVEFGAKSDEFERRVKDLMP